MSNSISQIELYNDEDRKIYLCPKVAQRIFSEQLRSLTEMITGKSFTFINVARVLDLHKNTFGYQIKPETLGFSDIWSGMKSLPFVEVWKAKQNVVENFDFFCSHFS